MIHQFLALTVLTMIIAGCAIQQDPAGKGPPIRLSEKTETLKLPMGMSNVPTLTAYLPEKQMRNGTAIIVCPGGGYGMLMDTYEGEDVCKWWNHHGVAAFLLRYRIAPHRYPDALNDVQTAIKIVRESAPKYGVKTNKIGVIGFSAGGHLAGSAATLFHPDEKDRPDFAILVYPVISLIQPYGHFGSRDNLLGPKPPEDLAQELSLERRVTSRTSPSFLVHGRDDGIVKWQNSMMFDQALKAHGVAEKLVLMNHGQHGFGLKTPDPAESDWTAKCLAFLQSIKMLPNH